MAIEEEEREEINCTNFQMFGKGSQKLKATGQQRAVKGILGRIHLSQLQEWHVLTAPVILDFNTAIVWSAMFL